jgi:hypothetical protein
MQEEHIRRIATLGEQVPRYARSSGMTLDGIQPLTRSSMAACLGCKRAPPEGFRLLEGVLMVGGISGHPPASSNGF